MRAQFQERKAERGNDGRNEGKKDASRPDIAFTGKAIRMWGEKPAKCPPRPSPPAKCARGRENVAHRRKRTHKRENAKIRRFLTAICKKARSAAFWQREGENARRISLSRSASSFCRSLPDFSTRREKNPRNFSSPLFAYKSILHFAQCENNILPSILKREFLQRSLIKNSAF